ncbi:hypothetical protein OGAPHI_004885 [Ogataea philodendri]|uniref:Uncharacterized protein n=2 Tax=Saccharomycotina TaxID=147537 RepID=A0A9P8T2Z8_9ASCO|nr:uncharacterized protein OGAPHI_004885 [Ogataea philodendri]KAH3664171.1 hypothetical protein OGAPHI_004885 [Ogataea philodendri]
MGSFELVSSFEVDYAPVSVKKWKSSRTGLELCLIDQECPIVNGWFAVATEIFNDSGCPHTLEHLVFMGSKKYPYKGLLDVLGNLSFSSTNAWTSTDQTVYTLTTAGWEGFKMLLPAYLDHVLHPTLTDEACYTEVYHVDSEGKEKGVVYSEMEAIESQSYFVTELEKQRTLYPKSGYKSETGGLLKNLRVLTNDEIRKFHADNYRPDNLCVILAGTVDENELLECLENFDAELPERSAGNKRPFVDSEQDEPLKSSIVKTVYFPDEDESSGSLSLAYCGPKGVDLVSCLAVEVLGKYLTFSSVSLFNKYFIEVQDPLATYTSFYTDDYIQTTMNIEFSNVPVDKLDDFPSKITKLLQDHAKELDLERIKDIIDQTKWDLIYEAESSSEMFSTSLIFQFLYGDKSSKDLPAYLKNLDDYEELLSWDLEKWTELFKKYFAENPSLTILTKPSAELYRSTKKENKHMIKDRKAELGKDGLAKLGEKLEAAKKKNDAPIPDQILESFGQPDPAKINFISTESIATGTNKDVVNDLTLDSTKKILADTAPEFPLYVHFENIKSNFVTIDLLCSTFEIDKDLLKYIHIFDTLFSLPIEEDGKVIPYEDVVKQLQRDTVLATVSTSFEYNFDELLTFRIIARSENYEKSINWFTRLLFNTKFTKDRVKVAVERVVNALPEQNRSGSFMLKTIFSKHMLSERSIARAGRPFIEEDFLRGLLEKIDTDFDSVVGPLEKFRQQLLKLNNFRVLVVGDVSKLEHPVSQWEKFISVQKSTNEDITMIPYTSKVLSKDGQEKSDKCYMVTTPGSSSSFMSLITKIPLDVNSPDAAKIILAAEFLECVEGPFWRGIRGTGLAYGANIYKSDEFGFLSYAIYRGADLEKCFEVGKEIIESYATGKTPIDEKMLRGAVSSVVNSLTDRQSNYAKAAWRKYYDDVLIKRGPNYNQKLMKALAAVTAEDVLDILNRYFVQLFDPATSMCFISCNPTKSENIEKFFLGKGYKVTVEHVTAGNDEGDNDDSEDDEDEEDESDDDSDESDSEEESDSE